MKRKLLIYLGQVIFVYLMSSSLIGCSKNDDEKIEVSQVSIVAREAKIERFISIMWGLDTSKVSFNSSTKEYVFGENAEFKMTRAEMENLYDNANEYRTKYETN